MNISGFDLNQLWALHVLLDEAHVARAARRLGITAPAASNALRRLRELFDDALLVRSGNEMIRTPLAERLRAPLARLMADAELLLRSVSRFDPAGYDGAFTLATSDHVSSILLAELDARLRELCPRAVLRVHHVPRDLVGWLEHEGDLVIGALRSDSPALRDAPLFEDRFVCMVCAAHPLADADWSVQDYAELDHVLITPRGVDSAGVVDDALARVELSRRIVLTVTNFWIAPLLIAGSERVVTLPARYAKAFMRSSDAALAVKQPPLELPPISINMLWHARVDDDGRHQWLREQVRASAG